MYYAWNLVLTVLLAVQPAATEPAPGRPLNPPANAPNPPANAPDPVEGAGRPPAIPLLPLLPPRIIQLVPVPGGGGLMREVEVDVRPVGVPSTLPSTSTPPSITFAEAKTIIEGLGGEDLDSRETALQRILALRRPDLPPLLEAAHSLSPLLPEVVEPLRSAVTHIYLTGEPYDSLANVGFLGINLDPIALPAGSDTHATNPPNPGEAPIQGIAVTNRVPGVAGYQYLQEGDVILAVGGRGDFRGTDEFTSAVRGKPPGTVVEFKILRGGKLVEIAIPLSPRPIRMEELNALDTLRNQRDALARQYWDSTWQPALDSTTPAQTSPPPQPSTRPQ